MRTEPHAHPHSRPGIAACIIFSLCCFPPRPVFCNCCFEKCRKFSVTQQDHAGRIGITSRHGCLHMQCHSDALEPRGRPGPPDARQTCWQVEDVISQLLSISTGEAAPTRSLQVEVPSWLRRRPWCEDNRSTSPLESCSALQRILGVLGVTWVLQIVFRCFREM